MSTPLKLKTLFLRNFLSFGNSVTSIDLSYFGSTLIQGENVDANSNNGAGKTTIINALCYAIYNKPFDNISLQRLINSTNNSKNTLMEVRLVFEKGDDEYEIHRCRGETFSIQILMNGEDITLDSVSGNDKLVEEIFGMSYDLFTKIVVFSGNSIPFLMTPVAQQRAQIEELFNITLLSEKAVNLKEIIKATEGSISVQEALIKHQEAQVAAYNKQLKDAAARVARWESERVSTLNTLRGQLEMLTTVNMDEEKELHSLVDAVQKEEAALTAQRRILAKDVSTLSSDVKKLDGELKHLTDDKCPYCMQQYEGAADKLVEKSESLELKRASLETVSSKIADLDTAISELEEQRLAASGVMKFDSLAAAVKAESNAQSANQKIIDLQNAENPHIEAHVQLQQNAVASSDTSVLDNLKKDLDHQQFLLKLLTDKNSFIRRRIINRTVPFLNNRLISYTKGLGLPHIVKFDDDMSCTVAEYGRELDFGNLSSGEKKRVNLALSLAFRDVLHHLHAKVNCLFIDEIDASLDGSGVENVFKLLKTKSRDDGLGMWVISHRPEAVGRFDRTVVVRKEQGFSKIVDEHGEQLEEV